MESEKEKTENVKFYINVEPLGLKFGIVLKKTETFQSVVNFVNTQIRKLGIKFELGRINENKTGAILLTENLLGDFLENNDEITVYSEEYGFTRTNLPNDYDQNSTRKMFYLKNVSDLYKSKNFLKKKRNENQKNKNETKKDEKKEDDNEDDDDDNNNNDENVEQKKEKNNSGNKDNKKKNKNNKDNNKNKNENNLKKSKIEKKEKKNEEKEEGKKSGKKSDKKKENLSSDEDN